MHYTYSHIYIFVCFCGTGDWAQGLLEPCFLPFHVSCLFLWFLAVLGFELRASWWLGTCSTTTPSARLLCFYLAFEIGSSGTWDPPASTSQIAGITGIGYHSQSIFIFPIIDNHSLDFFLDIKRCFSKAVTI
jgi:hypothetical protein